MPHEPLPTFQITDRVDTTLEFHRLSFLDAFYDTTKSGHIDTSFIPDNEFYYYQVMPLRLKNTGATNQKMINTIFNNDTGRIVKVYINDVVIKSEKHQSHLEHLLTIFDKVLQHKNHINSLEFYFRPTFVKFLD